MLVTAISIGISAIVLALLGIPVLVGCWYLVRSVANVEPSTANTLLGQHLPAVAIDAPTGNPSARLRAMTADRARWRELGFVLLRFPVGIATFVASLTLLTTSASIAYAPIHARYSGDTSFGDWSLSSRLEDIASSSPWSWLLAPLAALSFVASLHLMNQLADACGRWASATLGRIPTSTTTTGRPAATTIGSGAAALLRVHAATFAAVMAVLALIDPAGGGSVWMHWPLITWGTALGFHTALVRGGSQPARSVRSQVLRVHEPAFACTSTMLLLIDVAGGGDIWFYWPVAVWGALLLIHEAAVRRYGSIIPS